MKIEAVETFCRTLPDVTVGATWGHRAWVVNDQVFAWERAFSKADLERFGNEPPPPGPILALRTSDLDAKDALLALELPGFFTIPHFNGYAAVLIALPKARVRDVKAALREAHAAMAAKPKRKPKSKPKRKR